MKSICILFPAFCHGLREADPEFQRQVEALSLLRIPWRVVNIGALETGDMEKALRYIGHPADQLLIYRGWILSPFHYERLHLALADRGFQMLTSPTAYREALLFPEYYAAIADHSLPATWIEGANAMHAIAAAHGIGTPPYFIKDYIKSAKEIWPEGCVVKTNRSMRSASPHPPARERCI